jgi:hypothetical protein
MKTRRIMLRSKLIGLFCVLCIIGLGTSCSDDDNNDEPTFTDITITPEKDVYHVGDVVTCKITENSAGSETLKKATYWWYASWWFSDPNMTADFQTFDESKTCSSSAITLTKAGKVTLYFFGRLEYPQFDFRKVEIGKTITVEE